VDEFDAAIARGAAGAGLAGPPEAIAGGPSEFNAALVGGAVEQEQGDGGPASGNGELSDVDTLDEEELEEGDGNGSAPAEVAERSGLEAPARRRRAARPEPRAEHQSLAARAVAFLRASWAELQRMQWPDRRQTSQATAVVLGFVVVAGIYLGVADWVAQKIVNFIL
jgi:preprotein translocase SecE subunit